MRKTIAYTVIAAVLILAAIYSASAYSYSFNAYPSVNPHYGHYVDTHSYLRDGKVSKAVERFTYQQAMSPYTLVRSPYPANWHTMHKPYESSRSRISQGTNPFYGHVHARSYHCHGPRNCHYHNVFPSN